MSKHVKQLQHLDMVALREIDKYLDFKDRMSLNFCSNDFKYFTRTINAHRCKVMITESCAMVILSDATDKDVVRFTIDVKKTIEFGENGTKKEKMCYLKSEKGKFAAVEFESHENGVQEMKVRELCRDIPRFVSHLHTIFPWTQPILYRFKRELLSDLEQLFTHNELPFAILIQKPKKHNKENGYINAHGEDLDIIPENCRTFLRTEFECWYKFNAFFKNWQSGRRHWPALMKVMTCLSWEETFGGLIGIGLKKKGANRFVMYSKNQPNDRNMMIVEKKQRTLEIKTMPVIDTIIPTLAMIEEKRDLEEELNQSWEVTKETRTTKVTRKRTFKEVERREEVEKRLKTLRKQLKERKITFCNGMAFAKHE